jgi:preprotein translocase subunit YajC
MGLPLFLADPGPTAPTAPAPNAGGNPPATKDASATSQGAGGDANKQEGKQEIKQENKAVATTQSSTQQGQGAPPPSMLDFFTSPMFFLLIGIVFIYFFMMRGQRKQEKARKAALAAVKKGDEVLLISGKYGTIVDVREKYVIVKVDETNNIKEKYLKNAIQEVIVESTDENAKK